MPTYRKIQTNCKECKSAEIYYDHFHDETFCNTCGLILQDTQIHLLSDLITEIKKEEKTIRQLHYKRIKLTKGKNNTGE